MGYRIEIPYGVCYTLTRWEVDAVLFPQEQNAKYHVGDTNQVKWARLVTPQDIEIDRGSSDRVRVSDRI